MLLKDCHQPTACGVTRRTIKVVLFVKFFLRLVICNACVAYEKALTAAVMPAQVSSAVGSICLSGKRKPKVPVSRSSSAYEYTTPSASYVQSTLPPDATSRQSTTFDVNDRKMY